MRADGILTAISAHSRAGGCPALFREAPTLTRPCHVLPEGHGTTACQLRTRPYTGPHFYLPRFPPPRGSPPLVLPPAQFFLLLVLSGITWLFSFSICIASTMVSERKRRSFDNAFNVSTIGDEMKLEEFPRKPAIKYSRL